MKLNLKPLYSQLNPGVGHCPLNCQNRCLVQERAPTLKPPPGYTCPLSSHQAETYQAVVEGDADIIFNKSATGDGKTLSGALPSLLDERFRLMALYPTIELVEDQTQQQRGYHQLFGLDADSRIDRLFGEELNRRVQEESSNKFQELLRAIYHKPILLTNPDIFHFITHYRYRQSAFDPSLLPLALAEWPDLWMFDEFHIFGPHQEAAALNSLTLIRRTQQDKRPRRFLFTSATPKPDFIAQLQQAEFKVREISGRYTSEETAGISADSPGDRLGICGVGGGGCGAMVGGVGGSVADRTSPRRTGINYPQLHCSSESGGPEVSRRAAWGASSGNQWTDRSQAAIANSR